MAASGRTATLSVGHMHALGTTSGIGLKHTRVGKILGAPDSAAASGSSSFAAAGAGVGVGSGADGMPDEAAAARMAAAAAAVGAGSALAATGVRGL